MTNEYGYGYGCEGGDECVDECMCRIQMHGVQLEGRENSCASIPSQNEAPAGLNKAGMIYAFRQSRNKKRRGTLERKCG